MDDICVGVGYRVNQRVCRTGAAGSCSGLLSMAVITYGTLLI